jgi:hypothetical protein
MKLAEFSYRDVMIGVYLEPTRGDADKLTLHYRPVNGQPFPPTMPQVLLAKALKRWRMRNRALLRQHGVSAT